ncbi:hypothetical protein BC938DRAFT_481545 [Jimgerdemannia flammicorona]|uniref:Uncharacterized protein n=1 Tax=Jimgerdemannia flammicorona TaxID=994334 RepID=A0A433QFV2_9FUNG|nr:hypothetical protein BC938DRAFT_481545 [Jimgerdemannia flammicorona]
MVSEFCRGSRRTTLFCLMEIGMYCFTGAFDKSYCLLRISGILTYNNLSTSKFYLLQNSTTHEFSGSSCALFANRMHEIEHVKTMAVGGILHNLMTYQSFPGLQG